MSTFRIDYGPEIEDAIGRLVLQIETSPEIADLYPTRWLAISLIDGDLDVDDQLVEMHNGAELLLLRDRLVAALKAEIGETVEFAIAGKRFDAAHEIAASATSGSEDNRVRRTDRIDSIVTNRYLGIPIFLAAMWLVFKITTDIAGVFLGWVDSAISGPVSSFASWLVGVVGLGGTWFESLVVDGVVAGVGAILVFLPVLISLFIALALLEDSGYMARAAFVMDRVMRGVGLQGKSFLPMLVGFGCTVPAVYATRTLESERDRILTSLLTPFMSCSARLPVYVLMAAVFFPGRAGLIVFLMYLLGIAVALALGTLLRRTALPETTHAPSIMEMPPYRLPTIRSIWFHTWARTRAFLEEAGTIIFVTMLVVWLLMAIPVSGAGAFADTDVDDSAFATVASVVAPVFEPAGFGSWEAAGALMSGFVAKEVVIGTMAQVYGADATESPADGSSALMESIEVGFEETSGGAGALAALAFMVFVLLYTPCMAAVGAIRHEVGVRWMWVSVVGQSVVAWAFAVAVFQGGRLLGFG